MKNISTLELLKELANRGYATENLWCLDDVQSAIDSYNDWNETEFELSNDNKYTILQSVLNDDFINERINEDIEANVFNILDFVNKK
jgi:hypothetical protein